MANETRATPGKPRTTRLPLMGAYSNRSSGSTTDQRFVNMFPETRKVEQLENTKIFINKRPGTTLYKDFGTGEGRGSIYFNGAFFVAIGDKVYKDGAPPTEMLTLTGSTGPLGIQLANSSTLGDYLFICDGTSGWIIKDDDTVILVSSTSLYNINITTAGAGYGANPTVTIDAPISGTTATATSTVDAGKVVSVSLVIVGDGYLTAPAVTIAAPVLTFNPATAVNTSDETITITGHTYGVGNAVTYSNGGGTSIGGLTNGVTYYIINSSANTIKLATSEANAIAGTAINLTSVGTGTTHTLTGSATATATSTLNSFPSPHIPSPTFIDGYIVLAKGSDVYTSDLDEPAKWSSENFLSAEMFPDPVRALARQNNQVVVLGGNSIEFFYDAANAAGSPLSRNDATTIQMGVAAPYAVYQNEKFCAFISQSDSGGRAAWVIEGFQPKKISDEYIERILDSEVDMSDVRGYGLRTKGHMFYVINLKTIGRTLVYDLDEKLWHEWSSNSGGSHAVFAYDHFADNGTGSVYLLHNSNGSLYKLDTEAYTDDGTTILCELVTNRYDMDSYKPKFMHSVKVVGDRYSTSNSVALYFSDNDYQSWSNAKIVSLTDDFPAFHRLGRFRRRAFRILHSSNNPLRLESLEVVFTEGD